MYSQNKQEAPGPHHGLKNLNNFYPGTCYKSFNMHTAQMSILALTLWAFGKLENMLYLSITINLTNSVKVFNFIISLHLKPWNVPVRRAWNFPTSVKGGSFMNSKLFTRFSIFLGRLRFTLEYFPAYQNKFH